MALITRVLCSCQLNPLYAVYQFSLLAPIKSVLFKLAILKPQRSKGWIFHFFKLLLSSGIGLFRLFLTILIR